MARRGHLGLGLAALLASAGGALAQEAPRTILILDGSGSMWGRIDGRPKLEIAREVLGEALSALPADREIGLMSYGHRRRGDCADIELIVPPAAGAAGEIREAAASLRFLGKTPLTESVRQAAAALRSGEEAATVVLVTDGIESCAADPCALARELEASGVEFTAHVVGFGLTGEEGAQVACVAEATGGRYIEARDAEGLSRALNELVVAAPAGEEAAAPEEGERFVFEDRTLYPGAAWMPDLALIPTGMTSGDARGEPRAFEFPPEGTAEACAAQCAGDSACAAWRYEPKGSFFVEHARCFAEDYRAEFDYELREAGEGWASGLKPDAARLVRPWPEEEWSEWDGGADHVEIALAPPPGYEDRPVVWSAESLEDAPFEAMAMPYPSLGDFATALEAGRWSVQGEGAGFNLKGEILVEAAGERRFAIPLDPEPWDPKAAAFFCDGDEICEFEDALTGLRFHLPPGWLSTGPYFYETAGGARAAQPTVSFAAAEAEDAEAISLNLRQAGQGARCVETGAGRLCLHDLESGEAAEAFALLQASLELGEPWLGPAYELEEGE